MYYLIETLMRYHINFHIHQRSTFNDIYRSWYGIWIYQSNPHCSQEVYDVIWKLWNCWFLLLNSKNKLTSCRKKGMKQFHVLKFWISARLRITKNQFIMALFPETLIGCHDDHVKTFFWPTYWRAFSKLLQSSVKSWEIGKISGNFSGQK